MDNILLVDDEENILRGYRRSLRGKFNIDTAEGGFEALQLIEAKGPYPVVVSDMRMPKMNGVELLSEIKCRFPDTVRVLLTGNTDQQTAVEAINEGDVFRFLNKPCSAETLAATLSTAVEHHRLITAERDLLENTLKGSVELLIELMSLVRPDVLGQTMRVTQQLQHLAPHLTTPFEAWVLETATMLSQLGYTTLSPALVERAQTGQKLLGEELDTLKESIELASHMVNKVPRLQTVAEVISYQDKHYDGSGSPADDVAGEAIPSEARILKCLLDMDRFQAQGLSPKQALDKLSERKAWYDPGVMADLARFIDQASTSQIEIVQISSLTDQMVLAEDVETTEGMLLVCKGQQTTESVRAHLQRFMKNGHIGDQVRVLV